GCHLGDRGVQLHVHPALDELATGVSAQFRVERGQQLGLHLDQPDVDAGRVDVGECLAQHRVAQFGYRPGQLDAGGAATDHGDGELGRTRPLAELLDVRQEAVAQRHRVAAGVEAVGEL